MKETHALDLPPCCPISGNPLSGSTIEIQYEPKDRILEVVSLCAYVDSYQGGRGDVRSMEGMVQQITQDAADALGCTVWVLAVLNINPNQRLRIECSAHSENSHQPEAQP